MTIYDEIADFLLDHGVAWTKQGEDGRVPFSPDADDVERVLDKAVGMLYAEPDGSELEVGGLIIRKNAGHTDVFVHIGEVT